MFARLSGFRGSFTLQAANQIAQIKVQTLRQLVDRSLIQRQTLGRFCLHPLVHMFAAEKLQGMPEEKVDLHERHYGYFRDLLHQVIRVWWEKSDLQVMDQLRPDSDNLIAAWEWILGQERWVEVANYLEDLWQFYKVQGRLPEVMELLDQTFRVGQSASPEVDALQLAYWRRRIGQAYLWMSQLQQGEENFRVVVSLVDRPLPSGRFGYLMRILYQVLIQLRHRVLPSLVRSSNKKMRDRYHEAFIAYEQMAERAVVESKNLLFLYCILRSLNLSEITGERALMARAYATTGFAVSLLGLNMVTEYYLGKARQMIKGESSLKSQELVFRFSGFYYGAQGDHINAEKFLLLAANLAGELGQNWIQETNWTVLLFLALLRGDFEKALYFTQRIRTSARKRGDTGFEAAANYWEAAVRIEQNRCEEAILLLGEAEEAPPEVMNILDWVIVHTAFAQAYLRRGKTVSALDEAEKAAQIFCQVVRPSNGLLLLGNYYQADVYLRLWENEPDRIAQQKLRISARHTCHILEEFTNVFPSGKPRAFLYRGLLDWLEGNRRKAYRAWHKSLSIGERLDSLFDQGLAHYEIGRHLPPGEFSSSGKAGIQHLEQAREIFLKIGATYYLDQVDLVIEEIEHPASSP
jgi:tetratricopeptide (TPR) repeat protein